MSVGRPIGSLERGSIAWRIREYLREHERGATAAEIAEALDEPMNRVTADLTRHCGRVWRVARYQRYATPGDPRAVGVYRLGAGRNAPKPEPLSNTELQRRLRARRRTRVNSVFALGLAGRALPRLGHLGV